MDDIYCGMQDFMKLSWFQDVQTVENFNGKHNILIDAKTDVTFQDWKKLIQLFLSVINTHFT